MPFEHGFWLKSVSVFGHCDVTSLFSVETKMANTQEIHRISVSFYNVNVILNEILDEKVVKIED